MIALTDEQLGDFQQCLDWQTGMRLSDGRVLGVPGKRGNINPGTDLRVQTVAERLRPANKRILEVGCCEGIHTVQLSALCGQVVALEVRPRNICCALARLFVHGVRNVELMLKDVRELDDAFGRFDIVFHVGVLYHLSNPVEHIFRIRDLADDMILDTHFCDDTTSFERSDITYQGKLYRSHVYRGEKGWRDAFSGLEPSSRWLHRDSLLELLDDAGFDSVEVIRQRIERNGPRICLLARRTGRRAEAISV